jgi:hypothetical protein
MACPVIWITRGLGVLVLVSCWMGPALLSATAQVVDIPDASLREVIGKRLNKPIGTGDLTVADLERMTYLDASQISRGGAPAIMSLEGLQAARNLVTLDFDGYLNDMAVGTLGTSDLSPLSGLTKLKTLNLAANGLQINSATFPKGLVSLTTLYLWGNYVEGLSFLSGLTNLEVLDLSRTHLGSWNNTLTNLTLPHGLTNLRYLDVSYNDMNYLGIPESVDLRRLELYGFQKHLVTTILMLRIGPAMVLDDGRILLQWRGASGQSFRMQRSANLTDWLDWKTVTFEGTSCELVDDTSTASQRFYRVVEDNSAVANKP